MFDFLQAIFTKITSAVASVIIAVSLVSAPTPQPELPPQVEAVVETVQESQQPEWQKELADLEQARQLEQQRVQQELAQQNLQFCNGKNWSQCPAGQKFYCPATGDAQCFIENTQTSSATSRLKYCLQLAAEPENYKDPCDDPTYDATQKAFCGLATGGLRTSPSTKLSDCLGTYHPPSYSPPSYSPPAPSGPSALDRARSDLDKMEQEWRLRDLEQKQWQMERDQEARENERFFDCIRSGNVPCL